MFKNLTTPETKTVAVHALVNSRDAGGGSMKPLSTLAAVACTLALGPRVGVAQRSLSRSTAPARRSRTRSTRSGSTSTQDEPERADQLPADRLGRRHPPDHGQTVFFGATDGPMTEEQILAAPGKILHLPTVLGADVPVYNLPGVSGELKFTGRCSPTSTSARSRSGTIPALAKLNRGVKLPATDITVVHRSDGSGTTYIFVDYLAKVSPEWKKTVGVATSVNWPTGVGGKGNEGVAGWCSRCRARSATSS
jgi:hypothetical protein